METEDADPFASRRMVVKEAKKTANDIAFSFFVCFFLWLIAPFSAWVGIVLFWGVFTVFCFVVLLAFFSSVLPPFVLLGMRIRSGNFTGMSEDAWIALACLVRLSEVVFDALFIYILYHRYY